MHHWDLYFRNCSYIKYIYATIISSCKTLFDHKPKRKFNEVMIIIIPLIIPLCFHLKKFIGCRIADNNESAFTCSSCACTYKWRWIVMNGWDVFPPPRHNSKSICGNNIQQNRHHLHSWQTHNLHKFNCRLEIMHDCYIYFQLHNLC